jgi:hypothetical protein
MRPAGQRLHAVEPRADVLVLSRNVEKRPVDTNAAALMVKKIATGEIEDALPSPESEGKNPAAVTLGRMGGAARALRWVSVKGQKSRGTLQNQGGKLGNSLPCQFFRKN